MLRCEDVNIGDIESIWLEMAPERDLIQFCIRRNGITYVSSPVRWRVSITTAPVTYKLDFPYKDWPEGDLYVEIKDNTLSLLSEPKWRSWPGEKAVRKHNEMSDDTSEIDRFLSEFTVKKDSSSHQ